MQEGNGHPTPYTHARPRVDSNEASADDWRDRRADVWPEDEEDVEPAAPQRGSVLARPLAWIHHILRSTTGARLLDRLGEALRSARSRSPASRCGPAPR